MKQPRLSGNSNIARKLRAYFKQRNNAGLVFLFGSFAAGQTTRESDVDVGVLFDKMPDFYEISDIKEDLSALLKRNVDLAVLNDASPILKMQVLKKGAVVFEREKRHYSEFYGSTVKQYDDLKLIRRRCEENILSGRIYAR